MRERIQGRLGRWLVGVVGAVAVGMTAAGGCALIPAIVPDACLEDIQNALLDPDERPGDWAPSTECLTAIIESLLGSFRAEDVAMFRLDIVNIEDDPDLLGVPTSLRMQFETGSAAVHHLEAVEVDSTVVPASQTGEAVNIGVSGGTITQVLSDGQLNLSDGRITSASGELTFTVQTADGPVSVEIDWEIPPDRFATGARIRIFPPAGQTFSATAVLIPLPNATPLL